jgi:hypothetical protein
MSRRDSNLLWLRDLLEHLSSSHQQLEWTDDEETIDVLTDSMVRDLECCRRLCQSLRRNRQVECAV